MGQIKRRVITACYIKTKNYFQISIDIRLEKWFNMSMGKCLLHKNALEN